MTLSVMCARGEASCRRSFYRGEQYDPALGLYYLRARYYNPATGRFGGRDPESGKSPIPATLHKYVYGGGNPVNRVDPMGREALFDYFVQDAKATSTPTTEFLNTIGCIANIGFAAAAEKLDAWGGTGLASAAYGCVSSFIWPGGKGFLMLKKTLDFGACAFGLAQTLNDINNERLAGDVSQGTFATDAVGGVFGCAITYLAGSLGGG